MPTCIGAIYRIESDPNCRVQGKIQGRITHGSDSYPEKRFESHSTPTLTDIHIRRTLPLDYGLNYGFWMRIDPGIEALPNTVKGIYPQL